jgi:1-acyl-sn-glycerol-3-phosphate acyltransferase
VLFAIIKFYARLAIQIYCRKIIINKPEMLLMKGPVLFAANHPNSFLDGIILTTLLKGNLYSLARGDAFKNRRAEKLLRWLHLLPVYRTSEGVENLSHNYTTFAACHQVFEKNGLVMIFSEGRCINEWHLRPLKKGTARLAISAWQQGIPLTVLPVGFNYNTFRNFGKNVVINFGEPLDPAAVLQQQSEGKLLLAFNDQLEKQLQTLVFQIDPADQKKLKEKLYAPQPFWKVALLAVPAALGWLLHAPFYYPVKAITQQYFDNDHFDSVVASLLMLFYPIYLLFFCVAGVALYNWQLLVLILILLPFTAWCCVQLKNQLDS